MKKIVQSILIVAAFVLTFSPLAQADNPQSKPQAQSTPQPPADNSSAELKRIKNLAGRWTSTTSMFGKENEQVFVEYEVTSGGSAVLEKIFPGTPQEMISVYYDDNDGKLAMTHYCMMRNRPQLKLASSNKNTINMDIVKVDGLQSPDEPSMGAMSIKFKDKDHIIISCKGRGKGSEDQKPHTMEYTRVK